VRVRAESYRAHGQKAHGVVLDAMCLMLPQFTPAELNEHDRWYTKYRLQHGKRRDLLDQWGREREELTHRSSRMLADSARLLKQRAYTAAAKLQWEAERAKLSEELGALRAEREAEMAEAAALRAEEERRREEERAEQDLRWRLEQERKKALIEQYRFEQDARRQVEAAEAAAQAAEEEAANAERAVYNQERVGYRTGEERRKQAEREQAREEARREAERREARLDAIRAQVAVEVAEDPQRLHRPTESQVAEKHKREELFPVVRFTLNPKP